MYSKQPNFPPTRWSLVARAGLDAERDGRRALDELLRAYLPVLKTHLIRDMGLPPERVDDIVQDFVASRILQANNVVALADPNRGRFRWFLLTAFTNYAKSSLRRDQAQKRGPADSLRLSIDEHPDVAAIGPEQERSFNMAWARQILTEAIGYMRTECGEKGRSDIWGVFESRLLNPILDQAEPLPLETLMDQFGLDSPSQASNLLTTARRMFQRALTEVVRDTVADASEVEEEIRDLKAILGGR